MDVGSRATHGAVAEVMLVNDSHLSPTPLIQWLTEEQSKNLPKDKLEEVETELADTLIYLIRLADKLDINLITAAQRKIEVNERKYPVEKAKGSAEKYTVYE